MQKERKKERKKKENTIYWNLRSEWHTTLPLSHWFVRWAFWANARQTRGMIRFLWIDGRTPIAQTGKRPDEKMMKKKKKKKQCWKQTKSILLLDTSGLLGFCMTPFPGCGDGVVSANNFFAVAVSTVMRSFGGALQFAERVMQRATNERSLRFALVSTMGKSFWKKKGKKWKKQSKRSKPSRSQARKYCSPRRNSARPLTSLQSQWKSQFHHNLMN